MRPMRHLGKHGLFRHSLFQPTLNTGRRGFAPRTTNTWSKVCVKRVGRADDTASRRIGKISIVGAACMVRIVTTQFRVRVTAALVGALALATCSPARPQQQIPITGWAKPGGSYDDYLKDRSGCILA